MVVASLAQSLIPCASEASRDASIAAVADIVLAPDAMFATDASRDARATSLLPWSSNWIKLPWNRSQRFGRGARRALPPRRAPGRPRQGPLPGGARAASYILRPARRAARVAARRNCRIEQMTSTNLYIPRRASR